MSANLPGVDSEEIIGLRAFARLCGVSLPSIQEAIDSGRIPPEAVVQTRAGRKLRREAAQAAWEQVHSPRSLDADAEAELLHEDEDADAGGGTTGEPDKRHWGVIKTKQEALLAAERRRLLRLERQEVEGKLHRDEDVEAVWSDILTRFRSRILALPSKAAPIICATRKRDPAQIQALLDGLVREALAELAAYDQTKERIKGRRKQRVKRS